MQHSLNGCAINEIVLQHGIRAVTMENDYLFISILPDKGADIYQFVYKPKNIDILWKSSQGLKSQGRGIQTPANSTESWMENYAGGWQEIFPNGGNPCTYKGVELNFHGEISTLSWEYKITCNTPDEIVVVFSTHTYRSPFKVKRTLVLKANQKFLEINETIMNLAEEEMDYMWGHHPAFGAPFIDEGTFINLPDDCWVESQEMEHASSRLPPKMRSSWPFFPGKHHETLDLSMIPPKNERSADLAFIGGFSEGWYGVTNPKLGMGFGMVWPRGIFPFMWFWQEFRGSFGYPWYGYNYVTAIEPFSSYDASGLTKSIENGTARKLKPGETVQATIMAICFEGTRGITRIDKDGNVHIIN